MRSLFFLAIILTIAHACYHYNVVSNVVDTIENSLNSPTTTEQTQKGLSALTAAATFVRNQVTRNCSNLDVESNVLDLFNRNRNVEALNLTGVSVNNISENDSNSLYKMCSANVLATDNVSYKVSYKVVPMQDFRYEVYLYLN